jgi:hypothetical protein
MKEDLKKLVKIMTDGCEGDKTQFLNQINKICDQTSKLSSDR